MLTRKQHELLIFLHDRLSVDGISPSFDEMKKALGLKSKSGIHRLITGLEERGFIRRLPHRARAIEILRMPEDFAPASHTQTTAVQQPFSQPGSGFSPSVIEGGRGHKPDAPKESPQDFKSIETMGESVSLPLYGKIAAGTPIEALRDPDRMVEVPGALLGRGDYYALEVEGDSMIEAGILDGDTVIVERSENAENGTIVVALVDQEEVTLKRLRRRSAAIALEPANARYETRVFPPHRVKIQGRLIGLLRSY